MKPAAIALGLVVSLSCEAEGPAPDERGPAAPASKPDVKPDPKPDAKEEVKPDAKADSATPPAPGVIGMLEEARVKTACNDLQMMRAAVELFTVMKGECPRDLATLEAERVIDRLREDPWGHAYQLRCSELELRSAGPDGERGTPDDVVLGATGDECTPQ